MAKKISAAAAAAKAQAAALFDLTTVDGTAAFVDHYAKLEAAQKALEAQMEGLKALVKEDGRDVLLGTTQLLDVNLFEQTRFDSATAKTFLTAAQIKMCNKTTDSYRITVKDRPDIDQVADILVHGVMSVEPVIGDDNAAVWGRHAS